VTYCPGTEPNLGLWDVHNIFVFFTFLIKAFKYNPENENGNKELEGN